MDFLFEPNVVYLLLMLGFLLAFLALLSPGTGIIEVGAIGLLVVAGYGIANLPLNLWALALLPVALILFILSLKLKRRRLFLALSLLSLLLGSVFISKQENGMPAVNPLLALLVSGLSFGLIWYVAQKGMEAVSRTPDHSLDRLLGVTGLAETDIFQEGSVQVAGESWSSRSESYIPSGSRVVVSDREGLTLIVSLEAQEDQ
jgi:membrane-bound serine protease (ClpP class)